MDARVLVAAARAAGAILQPQGVSIRATGLAGLPVELAEALRLHRDTVHTWLCAEAAALPDDADALARLELAAPSGAAAHWRPDHGDALAEGLLDGAADAPRLRRLAAFSADPGAAVTGWRLATLIRGFGADVALTPDGLIAPAGFAALPPFLRDEARRARAALAAWLALEADTGAPAAELRDARPPTGAAEALRESVDWCACCGPPPEGAVARWWAAPGSRDWRCEVCCPPPDDDDRATFACGRDGGPAPAAPRAAPGGTPHARLEH